MTALAAINEGLYDRYDAEELVGHNYQRIGTLTTFKQAREWFDAVCLFDTYAGRGFRVVARKGGASKIALVRHPSR